MGVGFDFALCEWSETTTCPAPFWKLLPNVSLPPPIGIIDITAYVVILQKAT